jgi:hypothetical protein
MSEVYVLKEVMILFRILQYTGGERFDLLAAVKECSASHIHPAMVCEVCMNVMSDC